MRPIHGCHDRRVLARIVAASLALGLGCGKAANPSAGVGSGGAGLGGGGGSASGGGGSAASVLLLLAGSGQRLKAMALIASEAAQFQYIQDSAFGEPCEFVQTADGQGLLCVPTLQLSVIYLDAQCTQPVVAVDPQSQRPKNVTTEVRQTYRCPGKFQPYRPTYKVAELVPDAQLGLNPYSKDQDGHCGPTLGWGNRGGLFRLS